MVENITFCYLVHMEKKTSQKETKYFVTIKNRRDEFIGPCFHGIGYWWDGNEGLFTDMDSKEVKEEYIPWCKINHVESLMYHK